MATASASRHRNVHFGAARFNYGSTVVVLLPAGAAALAAGLGAETPVRLGQALARLAT